MKTLLCLFLMLPPIACASEIEDNAAIRKVLATFNDIHARPTVLTNDADIEPLARFAGREVSQVYFEAKAIRLVTGEVAFVDATASQYGSLIMKHAIPAYFVL